MATLSAKTRKDPTGSIKWEKKYEAGILPLIDKFGKRIIADFTHAWETGEVRKLEVGKVDPSKFYPHVDDVAEEEIAGPAGKVTEKIIPKAYDQGVVFGSIVLGAETEERFRAWAKLETLINNSKSEFKGESDEVARKIKRIIGDGILKEKTQGQIIKDIQAEVEMSKVRATRIIRTETMKAVNTGVMDRYRKDGIEPSGHGKVPPLHPGCRCTAIVKRKDGKMVTVWLAAGDERTCSECKDLDGTVI